MTLPISCKCFIGDTDEEARAEARHHLSRFYKLQAEHYTVDSTPWSDIEGYQQFAKIFGGMKEMADPRQDRPDPRPQSRRLAGDGRARRSRNCAVSASTISSSRTRPRGVPREARHRMMRRFTEEVVPIVERTKVPDAPVFPARAAE